MIRLLHLRPAAALAFAPADAVRAGAADGPVAEADGPVAEADGPVTEIVNFRLAAATPEAAFLDAARATGPLLMASSGFVSRRLSRGADGIWTDHVEWASLAEAEAAAGALMNDPAAEPFLAAIDPATIAMRHETLLWTLGAD